MYEIKAALSSGHSNDEQILDELIALFEAHGQDCTVGIVRDDVLGFVEDDMLAEATKVILRYSPRVEVQIAPADLEQAVPA